MGKGKRRREGKYEGKGRGKSYVVRKERGKKTIVWERIGGYKVGENDCLS